MRTGCHSVARSVDGLVERHLIRSNAYKHAGVAGRAEDWVTIAPVSRAVAILERLTKPARARRGIDSLWVVLKGGVATKDHLSSEIVRTLNQFRDHLDQYARQARRAGDAARVGQPAMALQHPPVPPYCCLAHRQPAIRHGRRQDPVQACLHRKL